MIRVGLLNTRRYEFREKRTVSEVLPSLITNMDLNLAYLEPKSDENSTKNTPKRACINCKPTKFHRQGRRVGQRKLPVRYDYCVINENVHLNMRVQVF